MCKACEKRGKTWEGDDPRCGFDKDGVFTTDNWNCATLNELRHLHNKNVAYHNDCSLVSIPIEDGWIVLSWYKTHGCTQVGHFITGLYTLPLTLGLAEQALTGE